MSLPFVIHHLRHEDGQPYGTLAFTTRTGDPHMVHFAIARCHDGDQFVKKVGRLKAAGRLKSVAEKHFVYDEAVDFTQMSHPDLIKYLFYAIDQGLPNIKLDMWRYE